MQQQQQQGYGQPPMQPQQGYGPPPMQQQGYGPPGQAAAGAARAPAVSMSGGLYITFFVISVLATGILAAMGSNRSTTEAIPFIPLPILVWSIMQMVFVHKMWSAINDGVTKPTPGAALGLLFVPFFSLYWVFVVWPGFATQYNAYLQRHRIAAPPLGQGLFVAGLLLSWVPLVGLIVWAMILGKVCAAVNALAAPPGAQQGFGPPPGQLGPPPAPYGYPPR